MVDASTVLDGLLLGSLYAMMALGLTMTYAITKVPNFAHAEYVTVGAYAAVVFVNFLGGGIVEAVISSFLLGAIVAMLSDELAFKPLFRRSATPLHFLVASIGVGLVIRYTLTILADIAPTRQDLLTIRLGISETPLGPGSFVTNLHAWAIPSALVVVVLLHLLLTRTRLGKGMRAMASNFDLARVAGIRTAQVRRVTWFLSGGLAGVGGALWAVTVPANPETGWRILLWIFAASILGGFVSFYGTILGGFIVGLAENVGIVAMNDRFGVSLSYRPLIALVIIIVVFLVRPSGLTRSAASDLRALAHRLVRALRSG
jgi:branched-subunit amino acid ABC-type transport system permease component